MTRALTTSLAVLTLVCGVLLGAGFGAAAAAAAPAPPNLSITLTDGVSQVHSDSTVSYVTKVVNGGSSSVRARLVLTVPSYVSIQKAPAGKHSRHNATWKVTVPAGKTITRTANTRIGHLAKGELRVTALASVYRGASNLPLIRTADADHIAGVTDPAHTVTGASSPATGTHGSSSANLWLVVGLPVVVVVVLLAGGLWWWRRRTAGRATPHPAELGSGDSETADGDPAVAGSGGGRHSVVEGP